jgi:hypothetical protein
MILLQYKLGIIRKTQQIDGTEISKKKKKNLAFGISAASKMLIYQR